MGNLFRFQAKHEKGFISNKQMWKGCIDPDQR